jgi:hypothetical protein
MNTIHNTKSVGAAILRVALIFFFLLMATDSATRVYYSYMPITTWVDFRSVEVTQDGVTAVVRLERYPKEERMIMARRVLSLIAPIREKACGITTQGVLSEGEAGVVQVPLGYLMAPGCIERLKGRSIQARLLVTYIYEFPFGVQRSVTRASNQFLLTQENDEFKVLSPLVSK